jgi:hypothetical protein
MGKRGMLFGIVGAVVLFALFVVYMRDRGCASEVVRRAKIVRAVASFAAPKDVDSFLGQSGELSEVVKARDEAIRKALKTVTDSVPLPLFFGDGGRVRDLAITSATLAQLSTDRRGTWLTYMAEIEKIRSALDSGILSLELSLNNPTKASASDSDASIKLSLLTRDVDDAAEKARTALQKKTAIEEQQSREATGEAEMKRRDDDMSERRRSQREQQEQESPVKEPIRIERPTAPPEPFGRSTRPTPAIGGEFRKTS